MSMTWRTGAVNLVDGYTLRDSSGVDAPAVDGVEFAIEGGYLHVRVPGVDEIQVVSAPAVKALTYQR